MPPLGHAYLQRIYRPIAIGFIALVGLTLAGVFYLASSRSTVRLTPTVKELRASVVLTFGPTDAAGIDLAAQIERRPVSAAATATPDEAGTTVDDHARGRITIHNTTNAAQPLAQGTRLQSTDGVIVRTVSRVDVPARGSIEVEAVADPLGPSGEIEPGRLTIVALRAANQSLIYGQVETKFTGGTRRETGGLSIERLTAASNQARDAIVEDIGASAPGRYVALLPESVATVPDPTEPADEYTVTVTMTAVIVTYDQAVLNELIRTALLPEVPDEQTLTSLEEPTLAFEEQASLDTLTVSIAARGYSSLTADHALIRPESLRGQPVETIRQSLLGSGLISAVDIELRPAWRKNFPNDASKITVIIQPGTSNPPGE